MRTTSAAAAAAPKRDSKRVTPESNRKGGRDLQPSPKKCIFAQGRKHKMRPPLKLQGQQCRHRTVCEYAAASWIPHKKEDISQSSHRIKHAPQPHAAQLLPSPDPCPASRQISNAARAPPPCLRPCILAPGACSRARVRRATHLPSSRIGAAPSVFVPPRCSRSPTQAAGSGGGAAVQYS